MRLSRWNSLTAGAILTATAFMMSTPLPSQAVVFVREFEKSGQGTARVSLQERVVYSLLEAAGQTANHRARCTNI
ncbi:MAG: hypothetical protein H7039_21220 [Bryobacteraceae bacterium]|nr:hypothetical protein [Bryobacteraceae bacterium]